MTYFLIFIIFSTDGFLYKESYGCMLILLLVTLLYFLNVFISFNYFQFSRYIITNQKIIVISVENNFRCKTSLKLTFVLAPAPKPTVMDIEVASSTPISLSLRATSIYTSPSPPCLHSPCFLGNCCPIQWW